MIRTKPRPRLLALALVATLLPGCFTVTGITVARLTDPGPATPPAPVARRVERQPANAFYFGSHVAFGADPEPRAPRDDGWNRRATTGALIGAVLDVASVVLFAYAVTNASDD